MDLFLFLLGNLITNNYIRMLWKYLWRPDLLYGVWQNGNFANRNFPFIAGMSLEQLKNGMLFPLFPIP